MVFSKIIEKKFDEVLGRYEGDPARYYFSEKDFPKMIKRQYDILGDRDVPLRGYFYYYDKPMADKVLVFDHGTGAGRLNYFREIERLARSGYTVYAYDHTGCVDSGGSGIVGFSQGINDLDHVLTALGREPRLAGQQFRLMGHSWGGYAAMNAAALHPEVSHVVSLAGFLSVESLVEQYLPKIVRKYTGEVVGRERRRNPGYADMDARASLRRSEAKLLYVQSRDDRTVEFSRSYEPLYRALKGRAYTRFLSVEHRGHTPQYSEKAAALRVEMLDALERERRKRRLSTRQQQEDFRKRWDWTAMTEADPVVWEEILNFLGQ